MPSSLLSSGPSEPLDTTTSASLALATRFPALERYCPHLPTVSLPQLAFLTRNDREGFYGGAAGGGKSDALMMAALMYVDQPGYSALLLRRTYPQLSKADGLIPRSHEWLKGTDAVWNAEKRSWTFPSGATLEFGHVLDENAKYDYQGAAYQYVGFDELTQFTETMFDYIGFSRTRRVKELEEAGVPIRTRASSNPGGEGHAWVKARYVTGRDPSVVFVPARVHDNPGLDVDEYVASLSHLSPQLRAQLLEGDWGAFEGAAFEEFRDDTHVLGSFPLDNMFERFECMDYGLNNPTAWHLVVVDFDGNLVFYDSHYAPGLPSETALVIHEKRKQWGGTNYAYADPSIQSRTGSLGKWGEPATIASEFSDAGIHLVLGNNNPRTGYARLRELIHPDPDRRFPTWHPRRGEKGSPRLFVVGRGCPELAEQLKTAPLQPIEKRNAGEMIDPAWESRYGHAVAAARYGVMSRPDPSEEPERPPDNQRSGAYLKWLDGQRAERTPLRAV